MYEPKSNIKLTEFFRKESQTNQSSIISHFKLEVHIIENLLNIQYKIASQYFWTVSVGLIAVPINFQILFAAFHKNLFSFFTCLDMNIKGFSGSARVLLRNSFEFLMYAKYSSISGNDNLFSSWSNGQNLSLTNHVFNKIKIPETNVFIDFWKLLCSSAHSSKYSQQVVTDWKINVNDISANFVFLIVLLENNYHLLVSHLINSKMKYYAEKYGDKQLITSLKKEMREEMTKTKKMLRSEPKKIISTYKKQWKVT